MSNCSECAAEDECDTCWDGYYVDDSDECAECPDNCATCSPATGGTTATCTSCSGDYILEGGDCDETCADNCSACSY